MEKNGGSRRYKENNTEKRIQQRNGKNSKSKQQHKHYFQFLIVSPCVLFCFGSNWFELGALFCSLLPLLPVCMCVCVYAMCSCQCCDAQQTAKAQTLQQGLQM